jgi:flagellar biosynthesis GTPase FlhF
MPVVQSSEERTASTLPAAASSAEKRANGEHDVAGGNGEVKGVPQHPNETDDAFPAAFDHYVGNTQWIDNDGLLRDDGAIFGRVSGTLDLEEENAALEEKLRSIRAYYGKKTAICDQRRAHADETITRLQERRNDLQAEEERLRDVIEERRAGDPEAFDPLSPGSGIHVARYGAGLLLNVAGCVLLGAFVFDLLQETTLQYPLWCSVGVVLLALFNAFHPLSLLFVNDEALQQGRSGGAEGWKLHVSEWALPLAGAMFVAVWAHSGEAYVRSGTVFLLLLAAFGISGRLLMSTVTRLSVSVKQALGDWRRQRARRAETQRLERLADRKAEQKRTTELRLRQEREQRAEAQAQSAAFEKEAEEKMHLFQSEYELARLAAQL